MHCEILKKLVLVANLQIICASALVIIKDYIELRNPFTALQALPVSYFRVRAKLQTFLSGHSILEKFRWPSEPRVFWRFVLTIAIP